MCLSVLCDSEFTGASMLSSTKQDYFFASVHINLKNKPS